MNSLSNTHELYSVCVFFMSAALFASYAVIYGTIKLFAFGSAPIAHSHTAKSNHNLWHAIKRTSIVLQWQSPVSAHQDMHTKWEHSHRPYCLEYCFPAKVTSSRVRIHSIASQRVNELQPSLMYYSTYAQSRLFYSRRRVRPTRAN